MFTCNFYVFSCSAGKLVFSYRSWHSIWCGHFDRNTWKDPGSDQPRNPRSVTAEPRCSRRSRSNVGHGICRQRGRNPSAEIYRRWISWLCLLRLGFARGKSLKSEWHWHWNALPDSGASSWGGLGSRPRDFGQWGCGWDMKYYYILSCTGSMFESGDFWREIE